jgi:hypothetical protein
VAVMATMEDENSINTICDCEGDGDEDDDDGDAKIANI